MAPEVRDLILKELHEMRAEMAARSDEMNRGFDRIDFRLDGLAERLDQMKAETIARCQQAVRRMPSLKCRLDEIRQEYF